MSEHEQLPASLDPELRLFVGRLMAGYEAAHSKVLDLCDTLAARLNEGDRIAARSLEMQVKLAEEREDLISRRHQRELEAAEAAQQRETYAELTSDVRSLGKLVGKKLLGVPLTGNDSHGLQDLLATMSPEQIESVMLSGELKLTQGQRVALAEVFQSMAGDSKAEAAE